MSQSNQILSQRFPSCLMMVKSGLKDTKTYYCSAYSSHNNITPHNIGATVLSYQVEHPKFLIWSIATTQYNNIQEVDEQKKNEKP